jgi:hypothetical protein
MVLKARGAAGGRRFGRGAPAQARMARKIIVERTSGRIESVTPSLLPGTDDQGRRSAKRIP